MKLADEAISTGRGPVPVAGDVVRRLPGNREIQVDQNIGRLLASLARTEYPDFEVLVVDDESEDRTAAMVEEADTGRARAIRLIRGKPLPEGWFGKPWACYQGAREARGDLLLFTDADTVHSPDLLARAVAALTLGEAHVFSLVGRQVMGSFWERLLQPQFFILLAFRFPRTGTPRRPARWRHAIANGQYLLSWGHFGQKETPDAFWGPRDVAVDDNGHVYVADTGNKRIVVFDTEGQFIRIR